MYKMLKLIWYVKEITETNVRNQWPLEEFDDTN